LNISLSRSIGEVLSSSGSPPCLCNILSRMPAMNRSSVNAAQGNSISNGSIGTDRYITHKTAMILMCMGHLSN
jgi:hypothetical protein